MNTIKNNEQKLLTPFFVLRYPLLPLNELVGFYNFATTNGEAKSIKYLLNERFQDPLLKEAIYLASPVLYNELIKYQRQPQDFTQQEAERLFDSIFKYFIRASSRCTPFGLFAGCTAGDIRTSTNLLVQPGSDVVRHLRLDMDFLCNLAIHLSKIPMVREQLTYEPNNSLYKCKGKIRYVEYRFHKGNTRTHHLVNLELDQLLGYVLRISKSGEKYSVIVSKVMDNFDVNEIETKTYVDSLIENKVIQSSLEPNVSGEEYFETLINVVNNLEGTNETIDKVRTIIGAIDNMIRAIRTKQSSVEDYKDVFNLLSELEANIEEGKLFQMDTVKKHRGISLSESLVEEIHQTVNTISLFSNFNYLKYSKLETFKRAFTERYENALVKLTDVLDSEIGIGYKQGKSIADYYDTSSPKEDIFRKLCYSKYNDFLKSNDGSNVIYITDSNLKDFFPRRQPSLPDSFNVMLNLYSSHEEAGENRYLFDIITVSPSTSSLLGRFCHADQILKDKVIDLTKMEALQQSNAIIAEIVHLPQSRIGNILSRPHLREYEIEYLAKSTLPKENRISIDDLYLRMDGGELKLFSKKLKKQILPKLASAHNYSFNSLSAYHLLCDLQNQGYVGMQSWDWADLSSESFLPRVQYKSAILSAARWLLKVPDFKLTSKTALEEFLPLFSTYKDRNNIPDYVLYKEGDNKLLINIASKIGIGQLFKILKKNHSVTLHEAIWTDQKEVSVKEISGDSVYTNEIIVPFLKEPKEQMESSQEIKFFESRKTKRTFFPGSEWLFIKVYAREISFRGILKQLAPFISKKKKSGALEKWFFIRYADPRPHLRLRFKSDQRNRQSQLLTEIHELFASSLSSGKIYSLVVDSYVRELERYGENTIDISEDIFQLQSDLILNIHFKSPKNIKRSLEGLTVRLIDNMTEHLLPLLTDRASFYEQMFVNYGKEFRYDSSKQLKENFQNQYRNQTAELNYCLDENIEQVFAGVKSFGTYDKKLRHLCWGIIELRGAGGIQEILSSFIHMLVNRMFEQDQRLKEFFLYYCLFRTYKTKVHLQKKLKQND